GEIAEANEEVEWESTLVNEDPYGEGWLAKIEASDLGELDGLMKAGSDEFAAFIAAEREKYDK
ncbi:MAG: glycine cleavage system protein H, partial [Anaerolineae bacterium]